MLCLVERLLSLSTVSFLSTGASEGRRDGRHCCWCGLFPSPRRSQCRSELTALDRRSKVGDSGERQDDAHSGDAHSPPPTRRGGTGTGELLPRASILSPLLPTLN